MPQWDSDQGLRLQRALEGLVAKRVREWVSDSGFDAIVTLRDQAVMVIEAKISAEAFVAEVESTSPEVAKDIRGRSPQETMAYINALAAFLQVLIGLYMIYQQHQQPVSQTQVNEVINQIQVTIVNNFPPPPAAPPAQPGRS